MAVSRAKIGMAGLASALAFIAISSAAQERRPPLEAAPGQQGAAASASVAPVWDSSPDR